MYVPADFAASDVAMLHEVMDANSFATIVSGGKQGLMASHVPVLIDGVMKALQPKVAGRAEGRRVSDAVKQSLAALPAAKP